MNSNQNRGGGRTRRRALQVLAVVGVAAALQLGAVSPSRASTTTDTNYVTHLYEDYLLRTPSASETTYWVGQLQTGVTRVHVVGSLLNLPEFQGLWTKGVFYYYLQRLPLDSEVNASVATIGAGNGDYLSTEATALGSGEYFANKGSTSTGFVTGLYNDVLYRAPDAGGLSYWVGQVNAGGNRASIARQFLRLPESAQHRTGGVGVGVPCAASTIDAPDAIRAGSYCIVLNRPADASGYSYWSGALAGQGQLPQLWAQLAASQEYYDQPA